jgi:hypothetical protein
MSYSGPTKIRDMVDRLIRYGVGKALRLICEACASGEVRWDCAPVWGMPSDYEYGPKSPIEWRDAVIELDHGIVRCGDHSYLLPKIHWADFEAWLDRTQDQVRQSQTPTGLGEGTASAGSGVGSQPCAQHSVAAKIADLSAVSADAADPIPPRPHPLHRVPECQMGRCGPGTRDISKGI